MNTLTLDERETHYSQTAQERIDGVWHAYTDDPTTIRKLDRLVERLNDGDVEIEERGDGRLYRFAPKTAIVNLRAKPKISAAQIAQIGNLNRKETSK